MKIFSLGRLPGIVLTVTKLFYFVPHKITGAAGHGSFVCKLTSVHRSIPDESDAGHFLSTFTKKKPLPKGKRFLFADGRRRRGCSNCV